MTARRHPLLVPALLILLVGAAMGFASRGAIPFPSSFACFLTALCNAFARYNSQFVYNLFMIYL